MSNLRINLDDLLHARTVESERIEFKATWDSKVTGHQVLKTICAFANDLRRHGSGYVVLGVAEKDGRAELPPRGLTSEQMDEADRWITGKSRTMEPRYVPRISREEKDGSRILVVWVPASETPPHRAPDGERGPKKYWVRVDDRTVDADAAGLLTQLHEQSAVVPWDARTATDATVEDISETKVREHLRDCGSALSDEPHARHIFRKMDLVRRVNDHELPLNVALLFFSRDPPPTPMTNRLPNDLIPGHTSPVFTRDTLPDALQAEHTLAPGHWAVLNVLEGSLRFANLETGEERSITAPAKIVIRPGLPHKVAIEGPLRCRIDFFRPAANPD